MTLDTVVCFRALLSKSAARHVCAGHVLVCFLLGVLAKMFPGQSLPGERTLRRWLRHHDRPAAPAGRRSAS